MAVRIPFRQSFRHASRQRNSSDNLLIRCRLDNGITGWGEAVPRTYITGESIETCFEQLASTDLSARLSASCSDWTEVAKLFDGFRPAARADDPRGCAGNALRCALELSALDAYGKLFEQPVHAVTGCFAPAAKIRQPQDRVRYSTTISADTPVKNAWSSLKMRLYGFAQCKVKVGLPGADDAGRLRWIRSMLGKSCDLRIDVNEAWQADCVLARLEPLLRFNLSCVEQPVPHHEIEAMRDLRPLIKCPIMIDESLTGMVDAQRAVAGQYCDLFNIRLSKCGGFLNSLRLAAFAKQNGIGFQLGCHPGETGILSAAGRHWACSVGGFRYVEGSYDRFLLRRLPTMQDISIGYGGWAPRLEQPGLGITLNAAFLKEAVFRQETFAIG